MTYKRIIGPADMVRDFHRAFGLPMADEPRHIDAQTALRRHRLLESEVAELRQDVTHAYLSGIAHELADVVYVAYGTALTYGIDLDAVLAEVHAANMTKRDEFGRALIVDGKVQKGPNYRKPDVAAVLARQRKPDPGAGHGSGPVHALVITDRMKDVGVPGLVYDLSHPPECDKLPYGQPCQLDLRGGGMSGWPDQPGEYLISAWYSKTWTDLGWEYDELIDWEPVEEAKTVDSVGE